MPGPLARALRDFFDRVYYDLRNLGQLASERALNFAVTNAFQASQVLTEALATGFTLETIEVVKSPFCRLNSDCWDVKLKFFDTENMGRSRRIYRYTIDVSDIMPVTMGSVKVWSSAC